MQPDNSVGTKSALFEFKSRLATPTFRAGSI